MLAHTPGTLNELMPSAVFASVNNLYHPKPQKREIDRQHARRYNAVTGGLAEQARRAASQHLKGVRATPRLEGWT